MRLFQRKKASKHDEKGMDEDSFHEVLIEGDGYPHNRRTARNTTTVPKEKKQGKKAKKATQSKAKRKPKTKLCLPVTMIVGSYGGGDAMQMSRMISRCELSPANIEKGHLMKEVNAVLSRERKTALKAKELKWFLSIQVSSRVYASTTEYVNIMCHGRIFSNYRSFENCQKHPLIYFEPIHGVCREKYTKAEMKDPAFLVPGRFRRADQHIHNVDIDDQLRFGSDMAKVILDLSSKYSAMTVCCIDEELKCAEIVRIIILNGALEGKFDKSFNELRNPTAQQKEMHMWDFARNEFSNESHVLQWMNSGKPGSEFIPIRIPDFTPTSGSTPIKMNEKVQYLREFGVSDPIKLLTENKFNHVRALDKFLSQQSNRSTPVKATLQHREELGLKFKSRKKNEIIHHSFALTRDSIALAEVALWTVEDFKKNRNRLFKENSKLLMTCIFHNLCLTYKERDSYTSWLHENGYDSLEALSDLSVEDCVSFGIKRGHAKAITRRVKKMLGTDNRYSRSIPIIRNRQLEEETRRAREEAFRLKSELLATREEILQIKAEFQREKKNHQRTKIELEETQRNYQASLEELASVQLTKTLLQKDLADTMNDILRQNEREIVIQSSELKETNLFEGKRFTDSKRSEENNLNERKRSLDSSTHEKKKEVKKDVEEFVREAKNRGKQLRQIMREGKANGYITQHIHLAFHGVPVPTTSKAEEKEKVRDNHRRPSFEVKVPARETDEELARRLQAEEKKLAEENKFRVPKIECTACSEEVSILEAVTCNNPNHSHNYCMECFTGIVKAKLEENKVEAPCGRDCPPFTSDDFYKVQDPEVIRRIDQVHRDVNVTKSVKIGSDEEILNCPVEGCGYYEVIDQKSVQQMGHVWSCQKCKAFVCIRCKPNVKLADSEEKYTLHLINGGQEHECKVDKERLVQEEIIRCERNCSAMTCSACNSDTPLVKEIGCNVVRCPSCHTCICFICGQDLGHSSEEAHNKYPHDNDVHGRHGCRLFDTPEEYVSQYHKVHARENFKAKMRAKGYENALVARVLRHERSKVQFQSHKDVYESLLRFYEAS